MVKKTHKRKSTQHKRKSTQHKRKSTSHKLHNIQIKREQYIKLYTNDKGTRLLMMPNKNDTSTASIYFYFKVGSINETPINNGISHVLEHLIFKGSPKFPNYLDISKTFDSNGIDFNAYTSKNVTAYHYKFLSNNDNLDLICKTTSDMVLNPLLRETDLKTERNVIIQEYNDDIDDNDEYIDKKVDETIFGDHPIGYPIIGTLKTINSINKEMLDEYHKKHYNPDNLLIGFSGKMNNECLSIITKYFGGIEKFKPTPLDIQGPIEIVPFVDKYSNYRIDCYPKTLSQDYIYLIFKTKGHNDPMHTVYKLLQNILGGNMSSRLFVEIREKLGLVYTIKCSITNYTDIGYVYIYTQNEAKHTVKCIEHIFKELVKMKKHGVTETELKNNKKNYCDVLQTNFDDIEYENEFYSKQILFNKPLKTLETKIKNIQSITAKEIHDVAIQLFDFSKVHIITFGKIKKNSIQRILNKFL